MLLTNKNDFIIEINDIQFSLKLTFKMLEKLYNVINDNDLSIMFGLKVKSPFDLIENFDDKENIIVLIYCYADGKLDKNYVEDTINSLNKIEFNGIKEIIKAAILNSMVYIDNKEENKNQEPKEKSKETFDEYYNYLYLSAITQLGFNKQKFYNTTPSELKQLLNNNMIHNKSAIIRAYVDIMNARNLSTKQGEDNKVIKAVDANQFFDMI